MPPPYTKFRFIAWEVPTATTKKDSPIKSGWDTGQGPQAVERLPVADTVTDLDAQVRLRRLAGVVDAAATRLANSIGGDDANTLKIFMVPEFYFRPPTVDQEYFSNTYPNKSKNQILDSLNVMFVHNDFKDWLFVCGTVMWNTLEDKAANAIFFNTAVCVRGGQEDNLRVIEKRLPSNLDGVLGAAPGTDKKIKPYFDLWKIRKQRVFTESEVQFGLEVCLDHRDSPNCRTLKNVLNDWSTNNRNEAAPELALHLLTAGGMPIQEQSVAARVGGYILRNDGLTNPGDRSELRKVQAYKWINGALDGEPGPADLDAKATLADKVSPAYSFQVSEALQMLMPEGYQKFPQSIVTYPALALPS